MATSMIHIDGSVLEGGGQILRNSMAYSALLGLPIRVSKIRAGRRDQGLKSQHVCSLRLVSALTRGSLEGAEISSSDITFTPGGLGGARFEADVKTAGSVSLMVQASLPCLLFAGSKTAGIIKGGTNASMAPQIDYLTRVLQPTLQRHTGCKFSLEVVRRGYFPRGGGEIALSTEPCEQLSPILLTDPGKLSRIEIRAFVAGMVPPHVGQRMVSAARRALRAALGVNPNIDIHDEVVRENPAKAVGDGSGIIIVAETTTGCIQAGSALGEKRKSAESVGEEAAKELLSTLMLGSCVDEYLQDQLIIFMALARGESKILSGPLSLHTKTAIHIASLLTNAKFQVEQVSEHLSMITCQGIGLTGKASSAEGPKGKGSLGDENVFKVEAPTLVHQKRES